MTVRAVGAHEWRRAFLAAPKVGELTTARVAVGLAASTYADGATGDRVRPAQGTLAESVGVNRTTAGRALRALVESGWLTVTERQGARPVVYRLTIPEGCAPVHGAAVHTVQPCTVDCAPVHQDQSQSATTEPCSGLYNSVLYDSSDQSQDASSELYGSDELAAESDDEPQGWRRSWRAHERERDERAAAAGRERPRWGNR